MTYTVAEADVHEARESVVALWPANQPTALPSRYPWYYLDNPLGPGAVVLLRCDGSAGSGVIGWTGFGPRVFYDEGRPVRAVDHADFAVAREHRTVMPALMLQRAATVRASTADFAYGFPNEQAIGIFLRLGYKPIGHMGRYVKVLRRAEYIARKLPVPIMPSVVGVAFDAVPAWQEAAAARKVATNTRLEWLTDFDNRFEALSGRVRTKHRFIGHRDAAFLRWRFRFELTGEPVVAALVDRASEELRAYAVVAGKDDIAQVSDFLAGSAEDLGSLLDAIVPPLRSKGFRAINLLFLGAPWVADVLQAHGFAFRGAPRVVTARVGPAARIDSAALLTPANWFMTPADRDF